jgi:hypothetical protein
VDAVNVEENRILLEALIASPPQDNAGRVALVYRVLDAVLAVPSVTRAISLDQVQPVKFPAPDGDCISAFTSADAAAVTRNYAPYVLAIDGSELVRFMSPEFGLAIASTQGIAVLNADFLAKVRADLSR